MKISWQLAIGFNRLATAGALLHGAWQHFSNNQRKIIWQLAISFYRLAIAGALLQGGNTSVTIRKKSDDNWQLAGNKQTIR